MLNMKKLITKILLRIGSNTAYVTASNGITGGLRLYKDYSTGTVRAYGYFRRASNITDTEVIFKVPTGFRSPYTYEIPMYLNTSSNASAAYYGTLSSSGDIKQSLGSSIREGFIAAEWIYS